jgi:small subunit ribosomal protein S6e
MFFTLQNPATGAQLKVDIDDQTKIRAVVDKSVGDEVKGEDIGYPGYIFKITGGSDRQGFPMKPGVAVNSRVRLLLARGSVGYRKHVGRSGERKRRTVRGSIVATDIVVLNMVVVRSGEEKISELETQHPRLLLPKRANKVRRLLNLPADANPIKHMPKHKNGKTKKHFHRVKVQRLMSSVTRLRREQKKVATKRRQERSAQLRRQYQSKVDRLAKLSVQRKAALEKRRHAANKKALLKK